MAFVDVLFSAVADLFRGIAARVRNAFALARIGSEARRETRVLTALYTALGKLHAERREENAPRMAELLADIDDIKARLSELEAQRRAIDSARVCASCGASLSQTARFCPVCGARCADDPEADELRRLVENNRAARRGSAADEAAEPDEIENERRADEAAAPNAHGDPDDEPAGTVFPIEADDEPQPPEAPEEPAPAESSFVFRPVVFKRDA